MQNIIVSLITEGLTFGSVLGSIRAGLEPVSQAATVSLQTVKLTTPPRPVHNFLLRHVYHSSISSMKVNKYQATLITFFLSACVHELVMWCLFKKLRGYLLFLQMCQLPVSFPRQSRQQVIVAC